MFNEVNPHHPENLGFFTVTKYLFRLKASTTIRLPPYKGSSLHGGFGHALNKISSFYYREIFEPGKDRAYPKPFVLLPPLDDDTAYQPGRKFTFELTLFGNAGKHSSICHAALEFLGREMGFGSNRGKFNIEGVETARPPTTEPPNPAGPAISGHDIAAARLTNINGNRITLHLPTRLRLKADGRLLRQAPPFHIFFARLLGRLNTLATIYGTGKIADPDLRDTYVVMLTAKGQDAARERGVQAGCDEYLTKPFSPSLIVEKVRAAFGAAEELAASATTAEES